MGQIKRIAALNEMMSYACDELCKYKGAADNQEELDEQCKGCRMDEFVKEIIGE